VASPPRDGARKGRWRALPSLEGPGEPPPPFPKLTRVCVCAAQSATASDCDGEEGAGRRRCEVHRQPRGGGSPITSRRRGDETESGRGSGRCACAGEQQHSLRTGKLAVAARSPGAVKAGDECRGPEALLRSSSPPLLSSFFFHPGNLQQNTKGRRL
jgi:hypothetical protein